MCLKQQAFQGNIVSSFQRNRAAYTANFKHDRPDLLTSTCFDNLVSKP